MLMKIEHFKPPFLLKILYWISYTDTHRDYGEGSYNVIKDGKEAIQGGKSEALKLLSLISLQITFQSKNENQSQIIRYIYHNRYATVIKGICSEEERMFDNLL